MRTLVRNGRVASEGRVETTDLLLEDGRVSAVGRRGARPGRPGRRRHRLLGPAGARRLPRPRRRPDRPLRARRRLRERHAGRREERRHDALRVRHAGARPSRSATPFGGPAPGPRGSATPTSPGTSPRPASRRPTGAEMEGLVGAGTARSSSTPPTASAGSSRTGAPRGALPPTRPAAASLPPPLRGRRAPRLRRPLGLDLSRPSAHARLRPEAAEVASSRRSSRSRRAAAFPSTSSTSRPSRRREDPRRAAGPGVTCRDLPPVPLARRGAGSTGPTATAGSALPRFGGGGSASASSPARGPSTSSPPTTAPSAGRQGRLGRARRADGRERASRRRGPPAPRLEALGGRPRPGRPGGLAPALEEPRHPPRPRRPQGGAPPGPRRRRRRPRPERARAALRWTAERRHEAFPGFTSTLALRHVLVRGEPVVRDGALLDAEPRGVRFRPPDCRTRGRRSR